MEDVCALSGQLVHGGFYGPLVYFFSFWCDVSRTIWQTWVQPGDSSLFFDRGTEQ
jgi:hypothetical protein